jgi:hypothetical protein
MVLLLRLFWFYGAILALWSNNPTVLILAVLAALLASFLAFAYIHDLLVGKKPEGWSSHLPAPNSLRAAWLLGWGTAVALVLTGLVLLPFASLLEREVDQETKGQILVAVFYSIAAYTYQIHYLVSEGRSKPVMPPQEKPNGSQKSLNQSLNQKNPKSSRGHRR